MRLTRRQFLAASAAATATAFLPHSRVLGANDTVRVAVIGLRWKGSEHVVAFRKIPGVQVATLCDVDTAMLDRELAKLAKDNRTATTCTDLRKVLDDKSIDAVVVATPNHWHALATIWACQAGKDVYVEKPVSYSIWEGRQMVAAARKHNRLVQAGTQTRSDQGIPDLIADLRQGLLGKIQHIRAVNYNYRPSIGKVAGPQAPPATVNYDLWSGPASVRPIMRQSFHYDWHWQWLYGGGECANNGPHYLDVCRWILGRPDLPPRVLSVGGRVGYIDDGETPNTQLTLLDYPGTPVIFEIRGLPRQHSANTAKPTIRGPGGAAVDEPMDAYRGLRQGVIVQCEGGYYAGSLSGGWVFDNAGKKVKQILQKGPEQHQANFIDAVRSRKREDLHAEILEGHLSTSLCHLANASIRLGKVMKPEEIRDAVKSDALLAEAFDRLGPHFKANEVDLAQTPLHLGPVLSVDSAAERFTGDRAAEANALLRREYREPFVIRDEV